MWLYGKGWQCDYSPPKLPWNPMTSTTSTPWAHVMRTRTLAFSPRKDWPRLERMDRFQKCYPHSLMNLGKIRENPKLKVLWCVLFLQTPTMFFQGSMVRPWNFRHFIMLRQWHSSPASEGKTTWSAKGRVLSTACIGRTIAAARKNSAT